jgi:hypothetical protein
MASAAGPFAFSLSEIVLGGYRETAVAWAAVPAIVGLVVAGRPPRMTQSRVGASPA